jgi:hypothetical protein
LQGVLNCVDVKTENNTSLFDYFFIGGGDPRRRAEQPNGLPLTPKKERTPLNGRSYEKS